MLEELEKSQRQLNTRLLQSEERYRLFFNSITDPVIVFRLTEYGLPGKIIEANDSACRILGFAYADMLNLAYSDLVTEGGGEAIVPYTKDKQKENIVILEAGYHKRDKTTIPVEIHARIFDHFGQEAVLTIASDISERKEIERFKSEAFRQIEDNMEQFAILNDHIRNPLQGIIGTADLMDNQNSEVIIRFANVIDGLINKMDQGFLESKKIHEFLHKYYNIGKKITGFSNHDN